MFVDKFSLPDAAAHDRPDRVDGLNRAVGVVSVWCTREAEV